MKAMEQTSQSVKFTIKDENKKYPMQSCQDDELNKAFRELHRELVSRVIGFCKEYGITIDDFTLSADSLEKSIECGSWQACTDSFFRFNKDSQELKDIMSGRKSVTNDEFNKIIASEEPYLLSL